MPVTLRRGIGELSLGLALTVSGCGGVTQPSTEGANPANAGAGSASSEVDGRAGSGPAGTPTASGAAGSLHTPTTPANPAAGQGGVVGGQAFCEGGIETLREVDGRNVVVWDEQQRVALVTPTNTIRVYDVSAVAGGGELEQLAELSKETFGLSGAWSLDSPIRYGEGLLVTAREGNGGASRVFSWQLGSGATELAVPVSPASQFFVADPEAGLAFVADKLIYRATKVGGAWVIGAPIGTGTQGRTPLAFDGDDLLIGLQESGRTFAGGGAGAAGGAASGTKSWTAQLERWSSDSELVASYPAVGNPRVATPARGGWLIGETNSFWGSYQAALEWLPPANDQLQTLTSVPVISASDGEDGARGVALGGDRVFAANCESGLLHGVWAGSAVQLTSRWKPSSANAASCDPVGVYVIGDLLVLDGAKLTFARVCGE